MSPALSPFLNEDEAYLERVKHVERWTNRVMTPSNVKSFGGLTIDTDETTRPGLFMAIYGTGGGGKTTLLSEIVYSNYGSPALLADVEGGSSSVVHLREHGLEIVHPTKWTDIIAIKKEFERGGHDFKTLIFDNISEIQALKVKSVAPTGMPEGSAALKLWGQITAEMMEFIRDCRNLTLKGYNVLMVLWEETEKDELTQTIRNKVNLTPKFGAAFPGMVTMLGRLSVPGNAANGYIRKLSFAPSERTDAKFRVAPTDVASKIPLELFLRADSKFLVDFLATVRDGKPFPVNKYESPKREPTKS